MKIYTEGHLDFHASQRWPQLEEVTISWRGGYGYVTAHLPDEEQLPLRRLRYLGSDTNWRVRARPGQHRGLRQCPRRINMALH